MKTILQRKVMLIVWLIMVINVVQAISLSSMVQSDGGTVIYLHYDGSQWGYANPKNGTTPIYIPFSGTITGTMPSDINSLIISTTSKANLIFSDATVNGLRIEDNSELIITGSIIVNGSTTNRGNLEIPSGNMSFFNSLSNTNNLEISGGIIQIANKSISGNALDNTGTCIISGNAIVSIINTNSGKGIFNRLDGKFYIRDNAKITSNGGCTNYCGDSESLDLGFFIEGGELIIQGSMTGDSYNAVNGFLNTGNFYMTGGTFHATAGKWTSDTSKAFPDAYGFENGGNAQILGGSFFVKGPDNIDESIGLGIEYGSFLVAEGVTVEAIGGDYAMLSQGILINGESALDIKGEVVAIGGNNSDYSVGFNGSGILFPQLPEGSSVLAYGGTKGFGNYSIYYMYGTDIKEVRSNDLKNTWKGGTFLQWKMQEGETIGEEDAFVVYKQGSENEPLATFAGDSLTKNMASFGTSLPAGEYILKKVRANNRTTRQEATFSYEDSSSKAVDADGNNSTFSVCSDAISTYIDLKDRDITAIEASFSLQKIGMGILKATYSYLEDSTDPESSVTDTIYADTTVTVINSGRFLVTAIPADGYELDKFVRIVGKNEIEIPEIKANEEFSYNVVVSDTLKAYFKEKEAEPIASKFTILKEGSGEFKATYTYLKDINDPNSAVDTIIYANTFVEVINNEDFTITATPSEGYELDRVVKILNGEEVDTLDMKVGEPLEYNVVASDTLKAYFKEIEQIPEEPEIITTDSILTSDQVNGNSLIVEGGNNESALELNVSGITVPSLTINANSVVSLSISGDNDLGKIENNGTLVIQTIDGNLNVEIENKGTFIDYTGSITEVSGFSINEMENETVKEGETVTLVASVPTEYEASTISYQWQRFIDNSWVDVNAETIQTRAAIMEDKPNELIVSSSETGAYRCLITYTDEGVSTTLTAYAEVNLDTAAPEDPDEDTDEPDGTGDSSRPDDTPTYYNVKVDDVCEGVEVQLSNTVVKEGNQISVYIKVEEGYNAENLKVYFKQSLFNYWEEVKEGVQPGEYIIYNVWADISIKVEGAVKEEPTGIDHLEGVKVYAKDGSIYVYTPNREEVVILNMTGAIVKSEEQVGLVQYDSLERGIYIIRIGDNVFKIKN